MDPVAPVGELDGTRNFVWPRGEPFHQRSLFDRNATQRTDEDFTIGTMHGDRPFRLAGARGNGDPFGARFPLVFLFEAAVDGADFHPQLRPAERDGASGPGGGPASRLGASAVTTVAMASSSGTCSQSRTTVQPARISAASFIRSRSTFLISFGFQYHSFALGLVPWSGQACQKQPSTKTATFRAVNAMSGRTRRPLSRSSR